MACELIFFFSIILIALISLLMRCIALTTSPKDPILENVERYYKTEDRRRHTSSDRALKLVDVSYFVTLPVTLGVFEGKSFGANQIV